jgi:hypothetical protein
MGNDPLTKRARLLRNTLNIGLACNLHPDLSGEACRAAFSAAGYIAETCNSFQLKQAIDQTTDPDTAREVIANRLAIPIETLL